MNTKPIPAVTMLISGLITCIIGYLQHYTLYDLLKILVFVLVCFCIIGSVAKVILDYVINSKRAGTTPENVIHENDSKS